MTTIFAKTTLLLLLICCATSCCYRMPEDDEYSMIPSTNNPSYTKEKASGAPGLSY